MLMCTCKEHESAKGQVACSVPSGWCGWGKKVANMVIALSSSLKTAKQASAQVAISVEVLSAC